MNHELTNLMRTRGVFELMDYERGEEQQQQERRGYSSDVTSEFMRDEEAGKSLLPSSAFIGLPLSLLLCFPPDTWDGHES